MFLLTLIACDNCVWSDEAPYEWGGVICHSLAPKRGLLYLAEGEGEGSFPGSYTSNLSVPMYLFVLADLFERFLELEADTWNYLLNSLSVGVDLLESLCDFGVFAVIFFTALSLLSSSSSSSSCY